VIIQSCEGYRVCFGTRRIVLCMSHDVEIVQDAGDGFNKERTENGSVGGQRREWRCRWEEGIYILEFLQFDSDPVFCWLTTQNGPVFIMHKHHAPHEYRASRRDFVRAMTTVCDARCCFGIL